MSAVSAEADHRPINAVAVLTHGPRANPAKAAAAPRRPDGNALDALIAEAEAEKAALEQRVAEAFTQGDRKEGGRIARQLERQSERLEELYAKWLREESSRAT